MEEEVKEQILLRQHMCFIVNELNIRYTNLSPDILSLDENVENGSFIAGMLEICTAAIMGAALQIIRYGYIQNTEHVLKELNTHQFFYNSEAASWFNNNPEEYNYVKEYLIVMDYLRLLAIRHYQGS